MLASAISFGSLNVQAKIKLKNPKEIEYRPIKPDSDEFVSGTSKKYFAPGSIIASRTEPNKTFLVLDHYANGSPCGDLDPDPPQIRVLPVDLKGMSKYSQDASRYRDYDTVGVLDIKG